jgi:hypothetical protein
MVIETGVLPRIVASGNGGLNSLQAAAHTHLTATPKVHHACLDLVSLKGHYMTDAHLLGSQTLYLLVIRKQFIEIESPLFIISLYNPEVFILQQSTTAHA